VVQAGSVVAAEILVLMVSCWLPIRHGDRIPQILVLHKDEQFIPELFWLFDALAGVRGSEESGVRNLTQVSRFPLGLGCGTPFSVQYLRAN